MKKISLMALVVAGAMLLTNCKKEEKKATETKSDDIVVAEQNMSLQNKYTGSNCPPCGSWGWDMFEELIAYNPSKTCNMGTYSQNFVAQNFITQTATDIEKNVGGITGYPTFGVNGKAMLDRTTTVNITNEKAMCKAEIDRHAAAPVEVNSGYKISYDSDNKNMTIKTKTKFFKDMTGDYYIAAYIVEDKALGTQASRSGVVQHHHVLRGSANNMNFGTKITSTTTAGSTFDYTFTSPVNSTWVKENIEIITVIWKKVGTKYNFVNAYQSK